jgi:hypothetical protein
LAATLLDKPRKHKLQHKNVRLSLRLKKHGFVP